MTSDAKATAPVAGPAPVAVRTATGLVGSAALGVLGGLLWGEVAPRATLQEIRQGEATIINAETHAFIAADGWFCLIAVVAGLITGVLGHRFLVSRQGDTASRGRAVVATGLILGAVAGSLLMMWLGGLIGLSGYLHTLGTARVGTTFESSLGLGAKSALAFWPLLTSIALAVGEWSLRRAPAPPDPAPAQPAPAAE